jgi:DNA-binding response OmpR family regulator
MAHWEVGKIGPKESSNVLIIEDDAGFARLVQEMIAGIDGKPFTAEHADNLAKGINRLGQGGVDVILLDLMLPDSEGIFTFFKLKETANDIPIVVLSAMDDDETAILAVREGAQDYLHKMVVSPTVLVRSLRHAIERKRGREELKKTKDELDRLLEKKEEELSSLRKKLEMVLTEKQKVQEALDAMRVKKT